MQKQSSLRSLKKFNKYTINTPKNKIKTHISYLKHMCTHGYKLYFLLLPIYELSLLSLLFLFSLIAPPDSAKPNSYNASGVNM